MIHKTHYRDRMTDHYKEKGCKANIANSWTIPPWSVGQTYSDGSSWWHSKTDWKPDT